MNSESKRLSINIVAQIVAFVAQLLINFLLTPFVVAKLGADAFGFISLAENFVLYAQILVIALNSMAGRFIAVAYHQNKIDDVKTLFSSVFYSNIFLAFVIFILSLGCVLFLEKMLLVPQHLILDVKILFSLIFLNFIISIIFSTFQVATFIKNRLELNAIRNVTSNVIRVLVLVVAFSLFVPQLWYVGLAAVLCTSYIAVYNVRYTRLLTPEIEISFRNFDIDKIKELICSGMWNSITKLGNMLGHGLDLLLANIFIDAMAMGTLSITKKIPVVILSLVSTICAAFAPSLTKKFAQQHNEQLKSELLFSVKLAGCIALLPCSFIFVFGDKFYALWTPSVDCKELYVLTILGIFAMPTGMALEGVQNIFTIANKVKVYSIATFLLNMGSFLTLLIGISFVQEDFRIYFLAFVTSTWGFIRVGVFLPIYGAICINERKTFFYKSIIKMHSALAACLLLLFTVKNFFVVQSWIELSVAIVITFFITILASYLLIFSTNDRKKIKKIIIKKYRRV